MNGNQLDELDAVDMGHHLRTRDERKMSRVNADSSEQRQSRCLPVRSST